MRSGAGPFSVARRETLLCDKKRGPSLWSDAGPSVWPGARSFSMARHEAHLRHKVILCGQALDIHTESKDGAHYHGSNQLFCFIWPCSNKISHLRGSGKSGQM